MNHVLNPGELKSEAQEEAEPIEEEEETTCRQAVIENIQNVSQDFLVMLVENVLNGSTDESEEFNIEVIPEINCGVVTFSSNKGKAQLFTGACGKYT